MAIKRRRMGTPMPMLTPRPIRVDVVRAEDVAGDGLPEELVAIIGARVGDCSADGELRGERIAVDVEDVRVVRVVVEATDEASVEDADVAADIVAVEEPVDVVSADAVAMVCKDVLIGTTMVWTTLLDNDRVMVALADGGG